MAEKYTSFDEIMGNATKHAATVQRMIDSNWLITAEERASLAYMLGTFRQFFEIQDVAISAPVRVPANDAIHTIPIR